MPKRMKVGVVGAGINGVTCAYQIQASFHDVDVILMAENFTPNTTSDVAAGYWRPPPNNDASMQDNLLKWGVATKNHILTSVYNDPEAHLKGFSLCHGYHVSKDVISPPYWSEFGLNFAMLNESELKKFPSDIKSGYRYTAPVTEGRKFLPHYMDLFKNNGGRIVKKKINSLEQLYNDFDVIINCSGVGARNLVNDENVFPIRGYVLRVEAPWIKEFVHTIGPNEKNKTMYIYPLQDSVVLGGYKRDNDWRSEIVDGEKQAIFEDVEKFVPSLKNAKIISEHVGFRPGRSNIRLELEMISESKAVIHNYGHGGNGLSLYWGCSLEVLKLFSQFLLKHTPSKL